MHCLTRSMYSALLLCGILISAVNEASAADLAPAPPPVPDSQVIAPSPWTFRFVPYGWLTSMKGTQTVRGRSVKVDASFIDIVEESDTLVALMGDFEARFGRFALLADLVWSKIGFDRGAVRSRSLAPGIRGTIGASLGLDVEMAILESGVAYEIARSGPLAIDALAGLRYWYQKADLSLSLAAGVDVGDLEVVGVRGIARSKSVDWLDPMIGARVRYAVLPGHNLFLRGDIGGFGAGSAFSWQAIAGYDFDFATYQGVTFSGVIGYRALYVDYAQGEGRRRYEFDMLQHGPVLGISARF
jgi:hypothetical protein